MKFRIWVSMCLLCIILCTVQFLPAYSNSPAEVQPQETQSKEIQATEVQLRAAIQQAKSQKDLKAFVKGYMALSNFYVQHRKFEKAHQVLQEAISLFNEKLGPENEISGLMQIQNSAVYMFQQDFANALKDLDAGMALLEKLDSFGKMREKLHPLRELLVGFDNFREAFENNQYPEAETHLKTVIPLAQQLQEHNLTSVCLSTLGLVQVVQDKLEEGHENINKAKALSTDTMIGGEESKMLIQLALAISATKQGHIPEAKQLYQTALNQYGNLLSRYAIDPALFQQEIHHIDSIQQELDKTTVSIESPHYVEDTNLRGKVFHWNTKNPTIHVYIASGEHIKGWTPEYRENLNQAFLTWQMALDNSVQFKFVERPEDPVDVVVRWHDRYRPQTGLTSYKFLKNTLVFAAIDFNLRSYDNKLHTVNTLQKIALHEVGHILGVAGHSKNPKDIMFPASTVTKTLSPRDIETMRQLYGQYVDITNPPAMTLSQYRQTPEYKKNASLLKVLDHF